MKNLIFVLCLALLGLSLSPCQVKAQTGAQEITLSPENPAQVEAPQNKSFISKVKDWATEGGTNLLVGMIVGIFAKNGWSLFIKKVANKGKVITKEVGELFLSSSRFLNVLDSSIKSDGKLAENSVKELLASGKEVVAEANDVIISIKPKV